MTPKSLLCSKYIPDKTVLAPLAPVLELSFRDNGLNVLSVKMLQDMLLSTCYLPASVLDTRERDGGQPQGASSLVSKDNEQVVPTLYTDNCGQ